MLENLSAGLALTAVGMGMVFAVLAVLAAAIVLLVRASDRLAATSSPSTSPSTPTTKTTSTIASESMALGPDELIAIAMAVRLHKAVRRKQAAPAMRTHQPGALPSRWVTAGRTRQNQSWQRRG